MAGKKNVLNPRSAEHEFGGSPGTFLMTLGLPSVVLGLYLWCGKDDCSLRLRPTLPALNDLWNPSAYLILVLWFSFQALIYLSPLGSTVEGTKLRDGSVLKYKMNAAHAFVISHVLFAVAYYLKVPVTFVYDHYLALAAAATLFSFVMAVYLYAKSFREGALLAEGGNTGSVIHDWFIGRELNPRTGPRFDWKIFCELRPGLIGWVLINYCMMAKQYELHGHVTVSMVLVCAFQGFYVWDGLWSEEAILTTMDIVHDGFGFMLAFGDLAWVPFTYSLQARYLVDHPVELPWWAVIGIVLVKLVGYAIFRGANGQKDQFRRDPDHPSVKHLKTLPTERGTKLIVSGWWGFCRHPNYVGDLIMALSWSLPCGFSHVIPYFYVTYFTVLLVHRQLRDEHHCKAKYGKDWDRYCNIVRWRLIPYVY